MFFKCKHPAQFLAVEKDEARELINEDFERVTYNLFCLGCREPVKVKYARGIHSVEDFMNKPEPCKQEG